MRASIIACPTSMDNCSWPRGSKSPKELHHRNTERLTRGEALNTAIGQPRPPCCLVCVTFWLVNGSVAAPSGGWPRQRIDRRPRAWLLRWRLFHIAREVRGAAGAMLSQPDYAGCDFKPG